LSKLGDRSIPEKPVGKKPFTTLTSFRKRRMPGRMLKGLGGKGQRGGASFRKGSKS